MFFLGCHITSLGHVYTKQEIKKLANDINEHGNGRYVCYASGYYIVFEFHVPDYSLISAFTNEYIVEQTEDQLAALFAVHFIAAKYIYHYIDNNGISQKRTFTIGPFEFLNLGGRTREDISLKDHPKACGVNIELTKPKGWEALEANGPHIVQKFVADPMISFGVQVNEMSTFISRSEAQAIFDGEKVLGTTLDDCIAYYKNDFDATLLSCQSETINHYPALHLRILSTGKRFDTCFSLYEDKWMVFYEDKIVSFSGCFMSTDIIKESEMQLYGHIFAMVVNNVRFPEQYNY